MSTTSPILYLVAYESDHTTVLNPVGGAPHSDDFKLASKTGQAGYQPFLDPDVIIRGGRFNPQTGASDVGEASCAILDQRIAAGSTNDQRWLTAFGSLRGVWVQFLESTDGGSTKTPIFSGRVVRDSLDPDRLIRHLTVRDQTADLNSSVFVTRPHDSITYASRPFLLPLGLQQAYGAIPATQGLLCTVTDQVGTRIFLTAKTDVDNPVATDRNFVSQFLADLLNAQADNGGVGAVASRFPDYLRCVLVNNTEPTGDGHFRPVSVGGPAARLQIVLDELRNPLTGDLLTSDPNYVAASVTDQDDEVRIGIFPYREPVGYEAPVIIDGVTWPQLWKDLLDGKFGSLNDDGSVVRTWDYDSSAFTSLIADADAPPVRDIVAEPVKLFDYIAQACRIHGYGWRLDAEGQIVPFRTDIPAEDVSAYPEIVGGVDTYTEPSPEWDEELLDAITGIRYIRYLDYERTVADWLRLGNGPMAPIPGGLIASVEIEDSDPFIGNPDLPENVLVVDDRFTRATKAIGGSTRTIEGLTETEWGYRRAQARMQVLAGMSRGAAQTTLFCKRTSVINARYPGQWVRVTVPELPDPDTYERGGTRFMMVSQRDYEGLVRVIRLIDFGFDTQADPPTITNCEQETGNEFNGVECDVALNANDDPVQVQIAVTAQSEGSPPDDDSPAWTMGLRITSDVTDRAFRNLPSGKRIWFRARSEPDWTTNFSVKSDWAAGNTYVDTDTLPAPTGFAVTVGNVYADAAWTNTNDDLEIEYLISFIFPVIGLSHVGRLAPGTTSVTYVGLETDHHYGFAVRYVDAFGGKGTAAGDDDTTDTAPSLDEPYNLNGVVEYPHTFDEGLVGAAFQLWFQSAAGWPSGSKVGVYMATETAVGAGTYGSYELIEVVDPVLEGWTKAMDGTPYPDPGGGVSPSLFNGQFVYKFLDPELKRKWKCRMETAQGVDLSIYSTEATVDLLVPAGEPVLV